MGLTGSSMFSNYISQVQVVVPGGTSTFSISTPVACTYAILTNANFGTEILATSYFNQPFLSVTSPTLAWGLMNKSREIEIGASVYQSYEIVNSQQIVAVSPSTSYTLSINSSVLVPTYDGGIFCIQYFNGFPRFQVTSNIDQINSTSFTNIPIDIEAFSGVTSSSSLPIAIANYTYSNNIPVDIQAQSFSNLNTIINNDRIDNPVQVNLYSYGVNYGTPTQGPTPAVAGSFPISGSQPNTFPCTLIQPNQQNTSPLTYNVIKCDNNSSLCVGVWGEDSLIPNKYNQANVNYAISPLPNSIGVSAGGNILPVYVSGPVGTPVDVVGFVGVTGDVAVTGDVVVTGEVSVTGQVTVNGSVDITGGTITSITEPVTVQNITGQNLNVNIAAPRSVINGYVLVTNGLFPVEVANFPFTELDVNISAPLDSNGNVMIDIEDISGHAQSSLNELHVTNGGGPSGVQDVNIVKVNTVAIGNNVPVALQTSAATVNVKQVANTIVQDVNIKSSSIKVPVDLQSSITVPVDLEQILGEPISPTTNPFVTKIISPLDSLGNVRIDIEDISGSKQSFGNPLNVSASGTSIQNVNIQQISETPLTGVNLPVGIMSSVTLPINISQTKGIGLLSTNVPVNLNQISSATISATNPLMTEIVGPLDHNGNVKIDLEDISGQPQSETNPLNVANSSSVSGTTNVNIIEVAGVAVPQVGNNNGNLPIYDNSTYHLNKFT